MINVVCSKRFQVDLTPLSFETALDSQLALMNW